jgi:hypothetical protein
MVIFIMFRQSCSLNTINLEIGRIMSVNMMLRISWKGLDPPGKTLLQVKELIWLYH